MGQVGYDPLGTYHWEGPEPPGGRPINPANTPEAKAKMQQAIIAKEQRMAEERNLLEKMKKVELDIAEEKRVCKEACDAAIAKLKAERIAVGGKRKNKTRKHSGRKTYKRR